MNTHVSQIQTEIATNGGITNFNQWLHVALHNFDFAIVGGWESPELSMSDECITAAFMWLIGGHVTPELKAAFIHDELLLQGDEERAELFFNALRTGDMLPLMREHVESLVMKGGHFRGLCESVFGPDRRPTPAQEATRVFEEQRG